MFASDKSRSFGLTPNEATDVVKYEVYADGTGDPALLEELCTKCLEVALPRLSGHIWQRDGFNLQPSTSRQPPWRQGHQKAGTAEQRGAEEPPACLWGQTGYGDNVEDEWLVAWVLLELATRFPGISARIWDGDGEFLLIEAAYALPKWLNPEQAPERVWLRWGELHLIPPPSPQHPGLPATPTTQQALSILRAQKVDTRAPDAVQAAISSRLKEFPNSIASGIHRARVWLPRSVAGLLQRDPQLVAPAVEAFHYRDLDDLRAARRMQHFPFQDMVSSVVRLSRCLYAQLVTQQYEAPRGVVMPMPSEPTFPAASLGVKLTAGFEMLLAASPEASSATTVDKSANISSPQADQLAAVGVQSTPADEGGLGGMGQTEQHALAGPSGRSTVASVASGGGNSGVEGSGVSAADLVNKPAWQAYLQGLSEKGYFAGELPGSKRHRELTEAAAQRFRTTAAFREMSQEVSASPAARIAAMLHQPYSFDEAQLEKEDSDSWLAEGAAELDAQLEKRQHELNADAAGSTDQGNGADATKLAARLEAFFGGKGGLEGAEVPADVDDEVDFDDQQFWNEMKQALGIPGGLRDDESEEGSSFYSGDGDSDEDMPDEEEPRARVGAQHPPAGHWQGTTPQTASSRLPVPSVTELPSDTATSIPNAAKDRTGIANQSASAASKVRDEQWEAATATDSDDDTDFDQSYSRVLDEQLRGSHIGHLPTEGQAGAGHATAQTQPGTKPHEARGGAGREEGTGHPGEDDDSLVPVDVDMNLVENLLASYSAQQGMPGPAGNLAGLLGLQLPGGMRGDDDFGDFLSSQ